MIANLTLEPHVQEQIRKLTDADYNQHRAAVEQLTRKQFSEAFTQAIASGDFLRHVRVDNNAQAVTYIPYRELELIRTENDTLRRLNIEASRLASEAAVEIERLRAELAQAKQGAQHYADLQP